ncbi:MULTISPECIES: hypothetical protein [Pseudomonas]|uniref:Uncharacterized protein n=1 Tax=Pseudomonas fluorescens TaxID=294 RepID=A0A5E6U7N1_PSEFL|nr:MULTISPECIES: hypothetical protein [Pseudomonas]VVM97165.1 hypothetical protein PS652_03098 [Pseudomonas fluorescens]
MAWTTGFMLTDITQSSGANRVLRMMGFKLTLLIDFSAPLGGNHQNLTVVRSVIKRRLATMAEAMKG